jgi:endoglucanase
MISKTLMPRALCCAIIGTLTACGAPDTSSTASTASATAAGTVALSAARYTVSPSSNAAVTIYRLGAATGEASVNYHTVNGSAIAGVDYTTSQGTATWAVGDTTGRLINVPILGSGNGKSFGIALSSVTGGDAIGSPSQATVAVSSTAGSSSSSSSSSGGASSSSGSSSSSSGSSSSSSSGGASSSSGSSSSSSNSSSAAFGIAVAGDKFVSTQTGSVLQLLGVSVSGLEQGGTSFANGVENYGNATDPGFAAMASWNMNMVRIPLNEDTWLGRNNCANDGGASSTLQSNLKQAVANANAAGIYVILDLHWTAPNSFGCPEGQGSMPDAENSVAFWTSVATAFKGNPAVIFELFNEPFGTNVYGNWVATINSGAPAGQSASDVSILVNGGTYDNGYMYQCNNGCNLTAGQMYTAPGTASFKTAGYQTIINAIRATGATNVILTNPIGWAGQIETWLGARPVDPAGQLGVGWHEDGSNTSAAQAVLTAGYPIVITEAYGIGDATFTWAMSNHVGFSYWAWVDWAGGILTNAKTPTPNSLGTTLKNSYCSQGSVNSLSQC